MTLVVNACERCHGAVNTFDPFAHTCVNCGHTAYFDRPLPRRLTHDPYPLVDDREFAGELNPARRYLSAAQVADRYKYTLPYATRLCREGRLIGAVKTDKGWVVPEPIEVLAYNPLLNRVVRESHG